MEEAVYIPKKAFREKRHRGMLDAIYWRLHSSYLKNKREDAKKFLDMLIGSCNEQKLLDQIGPIHLERFKIMKERIKQNLFGRLYGEGYQTPIIEQHFTPIEKNGDELEFCKKLGENKIKLLEVIGASPNALVGREFEMGYFGRSDFVIKDGRVVYVIEVKMGQCPNNTVAQIDRYVVALELDFCLGLYDVVMGFVMAEKFTPYASSELSRMGIKMIEHNGTIESLKMIESK